MTVHLSWSPEGRKKLVRLKNNLRGQGGGGKVQAVKENSRGGRDNEGGLRHGRDWLVANHGVLRKNIIMIRTNGNRRQNLVGGKRHY